jgi:prepilin-type N-terminal cleavage/methylation domain-containing protein
VTDKLRARLAADEGFTLIELLVVIIIIAILLAIAVPSYLGFRSRAYDASVKSNIRAAVPSAEAYFADNATYSGLDLTQLKSIDQGVSNTIEVKIYNSGTGYCLADYNGTTAKYYIQRGADSSGPFSGAITASAGAVGSLCP